MTLFIVTAALLGIIISLYLCLVISGKELLLTPTTIYCLVFITFQYPILFIANKLVLMYAMFLSAALIAFCLGSMTAMHGSNPIRSRDQRLATPIIARGQNGALYAIVALGLVAMLALFGGLPPGLTALISALSNGDLIAALSELSGVRAQLTKSHYFGGDYSGQGIFTLLNEISWQVILVMCVLNRFAKTENKLPSWMFVFIFVFSLFSLFGASSKGPAAWGLVAVFIGVAHLQRVRMKFVIRTTIALFGFVFLLVTLQPNRYDETQGVITAVGAAMAKRIFYSNGNNTYELITRVTEGEISLRYGQEHLTQFLNALPGVQYGVPFANELFYIINPGSSIGKTTFATYSYVGSMFLDFGFIGLVLISFIAGLIVQLIYRMCLSSTRTTLNLAFTSVLTLHLGKIVNGGLVSLGALSVVLLLLYMAGRLGRWIAIGMPINSPTTLKVSASGDEASQARPI
jgi:oligosaccharide repeat unit polymerase